MCSEGVQGVEGVESWFVWKKEVAGRGTGRLERPSKSLQESLVQQVHSPEPYVPSHTEAGKRHQALVNKSQLMAPQVFFSHLSRASSI